MMKEEPDWDCMDGPPKGHSAFHDPNRRCRVKCPRKDCLVGYLCGNKEKHDTACKGFKCDAHNGRCEWVGTLAKYRRHRQACVLSSGPFKQPKPTHKPVEEEDRKPNIQAGPPKPQVTVAPPVAVAPPKPPVAVAPPKPPVPAEAEQDRPSVRIGDVLGKFGTGRIPTWRYLVEALDHVNNASYKTDSYDSVPADIVLSIVNTLSVWALRKVSYERARAGAARSSIDADRASLRQSSRQAADALTRLDRYRDRGHLGWAMTQNEHLVMDMVRLRDAFADDPVSTKPVAAAAPVAAKGVEARPIFERGFVRDWYVRDTPSPSPEPDGSSTPDDDDEEEEDWEMDPTDEEEEKPAADVSSEEEEEEELELDDASSVEPGVFRPCECSECAEESEESEESEEEEDVKPVVSPSPQKPAVDVHAIVEKARRRISDARRQSAVEPAPRPVLNPISAGPRRHTTSGGRLAVPSSATAPNWLTSDPDSTMVTSSNSPGNVFSLGATSKTTLPTSSAGAAEKNGPGPSSSSSCSVPLASGEKPLVATTLLHRLVDSTLVGDEGLRSGHPAQANLTVIFQDAKRSAGKRSRVADPSLSPSSESESDKGRKRAKLESGSEGSSDAASSER